MLQFVLRKRFGSFFHGKKVRFGSQSEKGLAHFFMEKRFGLVLNQKKLWVAFSWKKGLVWFSISSIQFNSFEHL